MAVVISKLAMNPAAIASNPNHALPLTYAVAVKQETEDQWTAKALGWWGYRAEGTTREEALTKLNQVLAEQLAQVEIVQQTLPLPQSENPWLKVAGKYQDDPQFEAVLEHIAAYRQELDAEMIAEDFNQDEAELQ
jgi:predicted RNase H-like HicB family nuclease